VGWQWVVYVTEDDGTRRRFGRWALADEHLAAAAYDRHAADRGRPQRNHARAEDFPAAERACLDGPARRLTHTTRPPEAADTLAGRRAALAEQARRGVVVPVRYTPDGRPRTDYAGVTVTHRAGPALRWLWTVRADGSLLGAWPLARERHAAAVADQYRVACGRAPQNCTTAAERAAAVGTAVLGLLCHDPAAARLRLAPPSPVPSAATGPGAAAGGVATRAPTRRQPPRVVRRTESWALAPGLVNATGDPSAPVAPSGSRGATGAAGPGRPGRGRSFTPGAPAPPRARRRARRDPRRGPSAAAAATAKRSRRSSSPGVR